MEKWIKGAGNMRKIALDTDLFAKKVCAKEIFGSNLLLQNKTVRASAPEMQDFSGGNAWTALRAVRLDSFKMDSCPKMEPEVGLEPTTTRLQNGSSTN